MVIIRNLMLLSLENWSSHENFGPTMDQFSMEFWSALTNISMKNASPFQNNLERMSSPSGAAVAVLCLVIIVAIGRHSIGREFRF